jgi:Family of unknown function (DUF6088)
LRQDLFKKMTQSIEIQIFNSIKKNKGVDIYFVDSFPCMGNAKSVNKALERLVLSGELCRVAMGIYVRPVKDKFLGTVLPDIDAIAVAIAKRDKARIMPTGSYALYKLGLTTQVPLNIVYYTDASARKIKIENQTITFKKASAKNLSAIGDISKLAIQALRTIGKDQVKEEEIQKIKEQIKKEKPDILEHDLNLAPAWIKKLIQ